MLDCVKQSYLTFGGCLICMLSFYLVRFRIDDYPSAITFNRLIGHIYRISSLGMLMSEGLATVRLTIRMGLGTGLPVHGCLSRHRMLRREPRIASCLYDTSRMTLPPHMHRNGGWSR